MAIKGITTTVHADKRSRKRIGVKNPEPLFLEALENGVHIRDIKGQFRKFLDKGSIVHKSTPVVYRGYIFWHRNGLLITVIPLHHKWAKYIKVKE